MLQSYKEDFGNLCGLNRQIYLDYFGFILALPRRFGSDKRPLAEWFWHLGSGGIADLILQEEGHILGGSVISLRSQNSTFAHPITFIY